MSSKSDEKGASTETAARTCRAWLLTVCFTLFNASSAFIILALIAALLYVGLASPNFLQNFVGPNQSTYQASLARAVTLLHTNDQIKYDSANYS